MKWLLCKAEHEFNKEQDCSMYRAVECIQVFNSEQEAEDALDLFYSVNFNTGYENQFHYVVINSEQIGELVR